MQLPERQEKDAQRLCSSHDGHGNPGMCGKRSATEAGTYPDDWISSTTSVRLSLIVVPVTFFSRPAAGRAKAS